MNLITAMEQNSLINNKYDPLKILMNELLDGKNLLKIQFTKLYFLLQWAKTTTTAQPINLEITVAIAAPLTPRAGKPKFPKIKM